MADGCFCEDFFQVKEFLPWYGDKEVLLQTETGFTWEQSMVLEVGLLVIEVGLFTIFIEHFPWSGLKSEFVFTL